MTAKVELLTPSGGKVILDPTDTAVDRTLTLPAVAGTVLNTASDIEAQVKTATSATGSAPIYACRAWVNFDGTTTPPTIRASGNVSSITDNGTGDYTVNFTEAMPDADYSTVLGGNNFSLFGQLTNVPPTTSSIRLVNERPDNLSRSDLTFLNVSVFR